MAAAKAKRKTAAKKPAAKKPAAKKPAAKKAPAKKAPAKKAPAAKAPAKKATGPVKEKMTKSGILNEIAANTGLTRKQVSDVMTELEGLIGRHVSKRSPVGEFALPGLLKIKTVKKPAQKARKGVPNPFRPGETMDVAAKPASVRVRVTPLKKLKEMAQ